jgi:hypothetical protein
MKELSAVSDDDLAETFLSFRDLVRRLREQLTETSSPVSQEMTNESRYLLIEDELRGKQLLIFRFLKGGTSWTNYSTLKEHSEFWRGGQDSSNIEDDTVFEALKRLRVRLNVINIGVSLTIEDASTRTRLIRPE